MIGTLVTTGARKSVDFIFDFASPNAYLAWKALSGILIRTGAEANLIPTLLGGLFKLTGNQAPMTAFGAVKGKLEYERLESHRFIHQHNLSAFRFNPNFPINTLLIMRGLIAARRMGVGSRYFDAVLKAIWEDGQKMDDAAVVARVLNAAKIDDKVLLEMVLEPTVKSELVANTEAAVARGVFGVPTFFVGTEMFFGKERLGQVEAELERIV